MDISKNINMLQISELESLNNSLEKSNGVYTDTDISSNNLKKNITMSLIAVVSIFILLVINFSLDVYESYISISQSSTTLALVYLLLYLSAVVGIVTYIGLTIKSYMNLKSAFLVQSETSNINKYEQEKEVALRILKHYKKHQIKDIRLKADALYIQVQKNSVHAPFESIKNEIIDKLDKEAIDIVYSSAKEVSIFTAFAPGSALDSLSVIFSSTKLMKNIFYIYGYKTNLFTTLLIIRKILENASLAALVEYTDDTVNDLLGGTIISKLSLKVAQGIGNGVLMLRIGNILIQSARPFASDGSIGSYKGMVKIFINYIKRKVSKKNEH